MTDSDRPCACGAMRIPTDELLITDTTTVHRHGGPCYVDETRSAQALDVALTEVERLRTAVEELEADRDTGYRNRMAEHELRGMRDQARAERDELRAVIMRVIAACVKADIESIASNGEPGVIKTTTIRSALNGGPDEH